MLVSCVPQWIKREVWKWLTSLRHQTHTKFEVVVIDLEEEVTCC